MYSHADKSLENKNQVFANTLPKQQGSRNSAHHLVDNRTEGLAQRKLHEAMNNSPRLKQLKAQKDMAYNSQQVAKFGLGSKVIQAKFDDQDFARMKEVAKGDESLNNILDEVISIHNRIPEDINYGFSSKGGHAALNAKGAGQVVVKDERWALTKEIKNYFNAYGMEHDIERQSMIIHELTHLAELYANLPSNDQGVVPEDYRPTSERGLAKAMEPEREIVDNIYEQRDAVFQQLNNEHGYNEEMKKYLVSRLTYGFAINAENPTVFTEISYYLKAKGKDGTAFYDTISGFARQFYQSREKRKRMRLKN